MIEGWRWYGEFDRISLPEIAQTGAHSIVTALHAIPYGAIWPRDAIAARKMQIRQAGFDWTVVESLPVHEDIKRGTGDLPALFAAYRQSMANLAAEGIEVICYNFMPLLDWTRTDLAAPVHNGGTCLRFSIEKMAALELFMLERPGAENDYSETVAAAAKAWFDAADDTDRETLIAAVMAGLPGSYTRYDVKGLKSALIPYRDLSRPALRENFKRFLQEIVPAAEELGVKLAVHPDDPPRDLLGLPRIVSNRDDIAWILSAVDSSSNGLTLCTGSLGANPANDVPQIAREFAEKVHFAHLRNVRKLPDGSFEEAAHLEGDTDLALVAAFLLEAERKRSRQGRVDAQIVFRPDHGHELLNDSERDTHPGYPLIGRLRGLAELRGLMAGIRHAGVAA
ncbi:mannonate dehydratase [Roseibium aquae]|uniref:Mannonate dehydratase n=1 Tax=Roseibium aquae TaxID=1323746 RepID=A0A916TL38_9HYPH|nr:mannonate dehydratase [Roseibium aquae]GGB46645.1 mannonate dehydratase [Roseibium aquae]